MVCERTCNVAIKDDVESATSELEAKSNFVGHFERRRHLSKLNPSKSVRGPCDGTVIQALQVPLTRTEDRILDVPQKESKGDAPGRRLGRFHVGKPVHLS
jgi:hypothetical protein